MMSGYEMYKNNSVMTATPQELTLMLYEGAIKFNNMAMIAIDDKNIEKANNSILRVEDIISELRCTLDMEYEISKSLDGIYDFILRRLSAANIKKDKAILEEVHPLLKELRDTWKLLMDKVSNKNEAIGE